MGAAHDLKVPCSKESTHTLARGGSKQTSSWNKIQRRPPLCGGLSYPTEIMASTSHSSSRRASDASAASRPAKHRRMAPHGDNEELLSTSKFPSSPVPTPTGHRSPSVRGPWIPHRRTSVGSRKTPGIFVWSDSEDFVLRP